MIWIKVAGMLVTHPLVAALRYDNALGNGVAVIGFHSLTWIAAGDEFLPYHRLLKERRLYELRMPLSARPLCIRATQRAAMIEK
ncbi:MAG: hypothetical protein ABSG66_12960 [Stellaceae bacterium]